MNSIQDNYATRVGPKPTPVSFDRTFAIVLLYVEGIAIAEALCANGWVVPGLLLQTIILICALAQYALKPDAPHARALPIFGVVSILRILSLSLPLGSVNPVFLNFLVAIPLVPAVWLTAKLLKLSPETLGLQSGNLGKQILIAASGIPLALGAYLILKPAVPTFAIPALYLVTMVGLFLVGFLQELLFRGMLSQTLTKLLGNWGLVLSSVLFGAMYLGTLSPGLALWMTFVGLVFGLFLKRTRCLWGVGIAHGLLNICVVFVLPLLIPR